MVFEQISKRQIKLIKALGGSKKHRVNHQCFFVEGLKGVEEALKAGFDMDFIVASDDFVQRHGSVFLAPEPMAGVKVSQAPRKIYDQLSDTVTPQGILAIVRMKRFDFNDVLQGPVPLLSLPERGA